MHFLKMPFTLCPVLLTEETGGMPEVEKILLSINLIYSYEILVEDPGQNVYRVLFVAFNRTDPIEDHRRSRQALKGIKSA